MAITLNGTTGITTPAITAVSTGNLSYTGTLTGGTGVVNIGSGQVYKDASGNVGIGVTPSAWDTSFKVLQLGGSTYNAVASTNTYLMSSANAYFSGGGFKYVATGVATRYLQNGGHFWETAPSGTAGNAITFTQAMTLTAGGALLVACTKVPDGTNDGMAYDPSGDTALVIGSADTGGNYKIKFYNANGLVGYVVTSGAATSYITSSDYRLKDNIAPMTGALAKVALLKPCTYKWKVDGSDGQGFIAHELDEVVPGCVSGEKDAVDSEGKPQYQGIDTSFLVATLTAAIQEQQALISSLTTRLTALESK